MELLVALTVLSIGLLGCAATLLAAQRALTAAERLHVATQTAAGLADSLRAAPGAAGERTEAWGRIRWSREPGGLRVFADDGHGAPLFDWWIPGPGAPR